MVPVILVASLIVMFVLISYLNDMSKPEKEVEKKDLKLAEHDESSCGHCGTGGCQHKIF